MMRIFENLYQRQHSLNKLSAILSELLVSKINIILFFIKTKKNQETLQLNYRDFFMDKSLAGNENLRTDVVRNLTQISTREILIHHERYLEFGNDE